MVTIASNAHTPEEFLLFERAAEYKNEYRYGRIHAKQGESRWHNLIHTNLLATLASQLEGRDLYIYPSMMRTKTPDSLLYAYPDVSVAHRNAQFEDDKFDTLLDPILIIEIVSPTSEIYDRTQKFTDYRKIESLAEYILISESEYRVTRFSNQPNGEWVFEESTQIDDMFELHSINCALEMKEVYNRVQFKKPEPIS
jgi:Uma2 family endonuclease